MKTFTLNQEHCKILEQAPYTPRRADRAEDYRGIDLRGVLSGDDDFAVMPVQPPVVRVRPLIVPADEIQVVMTGFETGHHARIPMLFLQRPTTLVRTPPVRVLYPVRGLQNHRGHGRKP